MNNIEKLSNDIETATKKAEKEEIGFSEAFASIGFKFLSCGSNRRVYESACGKYVIKYARSGKRNQNKPEIEVYAKIPKKLRKYFLKSIAHDKKGFKWILTHRAKIHKDADFTVKELNEIADKLNEIFKKHDLDVSDLHCANVGVFKGKPVMIDYGYPIYFRKKTISSTTFS